MVETDNTWIRTYTGKKFYPLDPDPDLICIEDIAHGLSNICRFGGQFGFYSVASHSLNLANYYAVHRARGLTGEPILDNETEINRVRYALIHDASEAYIGDFVRPLKHAPEFAYYLEVEAKLQRAIQSKFKIPTSGWVDNIDIRHIVHAEGKRLSKYWTMPNYEVIDKLPTEDEFKRESLESDHDITEETYLSWCTEWNIG